MADSVDTAISGLYDSVLDPGAWPQALGQMARAFEADTATVWRFDPMAGRLSDVSGHGHDPAALALYEAHYVHLDPATPQVLAAGVGRWLGDETLLDPRQAAHRPYLHEFALPHGLGWVGGGQVAADGRGCLYLGVQRRPGMPRFGAAAAQRFARIAPHLARSDAMRRRVAQLEQQQALASSVLDRFDAALCVLDEQGRILLANAAAGALWAAAGPVKVAGGRMHPLGDPLRRWWPQALAQACGTLPLGAALRHPVGPASCWTLWLLPLPVGHALRDGHASPCALLVGSPPGGAAPPPEVLRQLFGLTPAEAEWLAALASGETAQVFALRRGVSIHTVRSHTAALLGKLDCRSQLELAALARRLPPLRSP